MTLIILGIGMLVLGIPFSSVIRNRPDDEGYLLDGETLNPVIQAPETHDKEVEIGGIIGPTLAGWIFDV